MAVAKLKIIKDNLSKIGKWIEDGAFEYQIFRRLGISKVTWEKYKKQCPELKEVLEKSRDKRNEKLVPELQNLMLKMARGYTEVEKIEDVYEQNEEGEVIIKKKTVTTTYPPNVVAIQICLKNYTRNMEHPWTDNPVETKIKQRKQELEEKIAENKLHGWK